VWSPSRPVFHVGLSAQRLVVARASGLWAGKLTDWESIDLPDEPQTSGSSGAVSTVNTAPWKPAVDALADCLARKKVAKPSLRVVLSGRFVRWQLLPWRNELTHGREVAAYTSLRFLETFGRTAQDWHMAHSPQGPARPVPACAVDAALMDALQQLGVSAGGRLALVTPYFSAAFDQWRGKLGRKPTWFGAIESDCVTLGLLKDNHWVSLQSQRINGDWRETLPGMMAQMGISVGLADPTMPIYLVGESAPEGSGTVKTQCDLPVVWLKPTAAQGAKVPGHRLALGV
jgi:hypothetical protein